MTMVLLLIKSVQGSGMKDKEFPRIRYEDHQIDKQEITLVNFII